MTLHKRNMICIDNILYYSSYEFEEIRIYSTMGATFLY